ncbi:gfo/Idh/MocA family oxidoreductase, partial [Streptomyces xantholiticus]
GGGVGGAVCGATPPPLWRLTSRSGPATSWGGGGGGAPPDTVHLVLRHASGASSTVTLGLSAPGKAAGTSLVLLGEQGRVELPDGWGDPVASFRAAVDALLEAVRTGQPDACDIRFGVRLTEILAEAEELLVRAAP